MTFFSLIKTTLSIYPHIYMRILKKKTTYVTDMNKKMCIKKRCNTIINDVIKMLEYSDISWLKNTHCFAIPENRKKKNLVGSVQIENWQLLFTIYKNYLNSYFFFLIVCVIFYKLFVSAQSPIHTAVLTSKHTTISVDFELIKNSFGGTH